VLASHFLLCVLCCLRLQIAWSLFDWVFHFVPSFHRSRVCLSTSTSTCTIVSLSLPVFLSPFSLQPATTSYWVLILREIPVFLLVPCCDKPTFYLFDQLVSQVSGSRACTAVSATNERRAISTQTFNLLELKSSNGSNGLNALLAWLRVARSSCDYLHDRLGLLLLDLVPRAIIISWGTGASLQLLTTCKGCRNGEKSRHWQ
jgi:hypothetical protein